MVVRTAVAASSKDSDASKGEGPRRQCPGKTSLALTEAQLGKLRERRHDRLPSVYGRKTPWTEASMEWQPAEDRATEMTNRATDQVWRSPRSEPESQGAAVLWGRRPCPVWMAVLGSCSTFIFMVMESHLRIFEGRRDMTDYQHGLSGLLHLLPILCVSSG